MSRDLIPGIQDETVLEGEILPPESLDFAIPPIEHPKVFFLGGEPTIFEELVSRFGAGVVIFVSNGDPFDSGFGRRFERGVIIDHDSLNDVHFADPVEILQKHVGKSFRKIVPDDEFGDLIPPEMFGEISGSMARFPALVVVDLPDDPGRITKFQPARRHIPKKKHRKRR